MLRAVLSNGREARIDPAVHGRTIEELEASLLGDGLTGSAAVLSDTEVTMVGGEKVPYSAINALSEEADFEP